MMVDVHLRDGRTVFRVRSRAALHRLLTREPLAIEDAAPETVWRREEGWGVIDHSNAWHDACPTPTILPVHGLVETPWRQGRVYAIAKGSIAHIDAVSGTERQEFERAFPDAKDKPKPPEATS